MILQKISSYNNYNYKTNFKSKPANLQKSFLAEQFKEQIKQINKNEETKNIFAGLTALAAAVAAEVTLIANENNQVKNFLKELTEEFGLSSLIPEEKEPVHVQKTSVSETPKETEPHSFDTKAFIERNPERTLYLKITSYFPNLDNSYKTMLEKELTEPDNAENEVDLNVLESLFGYMSKPERLMNMKSYFALLNDYSENITDITKNISSTLKGGQSFMYYMVLLNNGKLSKDDIKTWAESSSLNCDEFMMFRHFGKPTILELGKIKKENNNNFTISDIEPMQKDLGYNKTHAFKVNFNDDVPATSRLKIVADIHKAMYGSIHLKENKDTKDTYMVEDIQSEMIDCIIKDRRMNAVYNFVNFINPKALKKYKLSSFEVKSLSTDDKAYKDIKNICKKEIVDLNFKNPKLQQLCTVINDDKIFGDIIKTRHGRLRFITRFVLKDNAHPKPSLQEDCRYKMIELNKELKENSNLCNYYCYVHPKGLAPQFYIKNSKLGNFIKVTLNDEGSIHTIYEDINKELLRKEN